jgi:D-hexose-6-phosphate mutarotase
MIIDDKLTLKLETTNLSNKNLSISEALHAYCRIRDIEAITVTGLNQCAYIDKLDQERKNDKRPLLINQEIDRIYTNTSDVVTLLDPGYKRKIIISKSGSLSTIIWTPWDKTATKMSDIGPHHWRSMICIESANVKDNSILLAPSEKHCLTTTYTVESLIS